MWDSAALGSPDSSRLRKDAVEKLVRGQTASGYESDFSDDEDEDEEDEASGSGSVGDGGSAGSNAQGASPGTHPVRHQVPRILRAAGKTIGRESSDGRMLDFVERIVDGANARGALVPHAVMRQALSAGDARNAESMLVLMREMELEPSTEDYNISMSIARAGTGTGAGAATIISASLPPHSSVHRLWHGSALSLPLASHMARHTRTHGVGSVGTGVGA